MAVSVQEQEEFFKKFATPAHSSVLFPSVALAQSALESGYGKSELASKYNNLFGIKASSDWTGDAIDFASDEYYSGAWTKPVSAFRVYKTKNGSFKDHSEFLKKYTRYSETISAGNPVDQILALGRSGYATDPTYDQKLYDIWVKHNLKRFDSVAYKYNWFKILGITGVLIGLSYFIFKMPNK